MPLEADLKPGQKWTFCGDVTNNFDDMLARSIPQYQEMRRLCFDLGNRFVKEKTAIIDLGCSRGEAMAPFVDKWGALCTHVGVETSPPMLTAVRERFAGYAQSGTVVITDLDLRKSYPPFKASLTLCVLTLQFTPIEHRQRILRDAWRATLPSGAFILVEKVMGSCAETDKLMNETYWDLKASNGYGRDEIERKRLSLEGVLVPVTSRWNEDLLLAAGFRQIEQFWRCLNFCGWIAMRE